MELALEVQYRNSDDGWVICSLLDKLVEAKIIADYKVITPFVEKGIEHWSVQIYVDGCYSDS